jgi:hypothetical protein
VSVLLTPRRRALLAVLVSCPIGAAYFAVVLHLVTNLAHGIRGDVIVCSHGTLRSLDAFNGCGFGSPGDGGGAPCWC